MGLLGAEGGPRNWQVAGMYLDLLGPVESFARTPFRSVQGPFGMVRVMKAEDLLVEHVLVSVYPGENATARKCARELAVVALSGALQMNWAQLGTAPGSGRHPACRGTGRPARWSGWDAGRNHKCQAALGPSPP
jgi:hypothetical protein